MADVSDSVLSQSVVRSLGDKLYDTRKGAALEIEHQVKEQCEKEDVAGVRAVISSLSSTFAFSTQANHRKGGLIGLAAVAIAVAPDVDAFLADLLPPVLKCFTDQDNRVRYYACESFYNIAKVARQLLIRSFNEIFDALCKLIADSDPNVQNGAQLVDRLMHDIVTESTQFDMDKFIPTLGVRIKVINPYVRQFVCTWITVLDSMPHIDMLDYVPQFLGGLFDMLSDENTEVRQQADTAIAEFLIEMKKARENGEDDGYDHLAVTRIVLPYANVKDDFSRSIAIMWLGQLIDLGGQQILPITADLLASVLPCISHRTAQIQRSAVSTNRKLLALVRSLEGAAKLDVDVDAVLERITLQLPSRGKPTRLAALYWISTLLLLYPDEVLAFLSQLFPVLLKTLSDEEDEIVCLDIEVLARISLNDDYFNLFLENLVKLFSTDRALLERRADLVVRQISLVLPPAKIFAKFASILESEEDLVFASTMTQRLNLIMLTSPELRDLRKLLRDESSAEGRALFATLYRCWCHSAGATFTLCLLTEAYAHASDLVHRFARLEVTVPFLLELDKLVRLFESPVLTHVRLCLLQPAAYPDLFRAMHGILMLLPQSAAYRTLQNRLDSVQQLHTLSASSSSAAKKDKAGTGVDWKALGANFDAVQKRHEEARHAQAPVDPMLMRTADGGLARNADLHATFLEDDGPADGESQQKLEEIEVLNEPEVNLIA